MKKAAKITLVFFKWLGYLILGLILLLLLAIVILRTEWAQNKIVSYATNYVSEKTGTTVEIGKLYLTFDGNIYLEDIYLEDQKQDTLLFGQKLETGISIPAILKGDISLSEISANNLTANIVQRRDSTFNFSFLMEAFAPQDSSATTPAADSNQSGGMNFSLGPLSLRHIRFQYTDSLLGLKLAVNLSELDAEPEEIDLQAFRYSVEDIYLSGVKASLHQFAPPPPSDDSSATPLPYLAYQNIELADIRFVYRSYDNTDMKVDLRYFKTEEGRLDLAQQKIELAYLSLKESDIRLKIPQSSGSSQTSAPLNLWPDWEISLAEIALHNNNFEFQQGPAKASSGTLDPSHLALRDIDLGMREIQYAPQSLSLEIDSVSFSERSGFQLRQLQAAARITDREMVLNGLKVQTNQSSLHTDAHLSYSQLQNFLNEPLQFNNLKLHIHDSRIVLQDAYYFNDSLRNQPLMRQTDTYPLRLSMKAEGDVGEISLAYLQLEWLNNTSLNASGKILGLPDTNNLRFNLPALKAYSSRGDMAMLLNREDASSLPAYLRINSRLSGSLAQLQAEVTATTPQGSLDLTASASDLMGTPQYRGSLQTENFNAGTFLNTQDLDSLSMSLQFEGRGIEPQSMSLQTDFDFSRLKYNGYDYSALKLMAMVENGQATVQASHNDVNLDFKLEAEAELDSNYITATFDLDLEGADLHDLNFSASKIKLGTSLSGHYAGTPKNFQSAINVRRAIVMRQDRSYRIDTIFASLDNSFNKTFLQIQSPVLKGDMQSNHGLQSTFSVLRDYIGRVVDRDSLSRDSVYDNLIVDANFHLVNSPLLENVLLPRLEQMDSIQIDFVFDPGNNLLDLKAVSPLIVYGGAELKNLNARLTADDDSLITHLGFEHFYFGDIRMHQTDINTEITEGNGFARARILDEEGAEVFYTSMTLRGNTEVSTLTIDPSHLVLNANPWQIPADNSVRIEDGRIFFNQLIISRNEQQISFNSLNEGRDVALDFRNFKLEALFSVLNPNESPVRGELNGQLEIIDFDASPAFVANLQIDRLRVLENPMGRLTLDASSEDGRLYEMDMRLRGDSIILSLAGNYQLGGQSPNLDMRLDITRLKTALLQGFLPNVLSDSEGLITGNMAIEGPLNELDYKGNITFVDVATTPLFLGTEFRLNRDIIRIDKEAIHLNNFSLQDANGSTTTVNGKILTENILNPGFDLQLKAKNFQFLNSREINEQDFYGKAVMDIDLTLEGDLNLPVVEARVKLLEQSDITYAVPLYQAKVQERKGVVRFRNMKDSTDVFAAEEEVSAVVKGMDVNARLIIDPQTRFNIIIDPETGDILTLQGRGQLQLDVFPNGEVQLVGNYELSDGFYELSLYDLAQKRFNIVEGSSVRWTGDPLEAILDITAIYKLEAPTTDLMTDRLSGADAGTINRYKQEVPFEVMLYIDGTIAEPDISFGLEMPDESKTVLGGSVYSRVQQLNESESELNKQVFSLVVFNRFLPGNVAADDGSGTSALARSSVSKLLSNQLNKLSERYISGIEVNFDVDSYTDYQTGTAQQRTDLNISLKKTFADGRVIVQVGSQVGLEGQPQRSSVIGDVQAEYLITENGTYRAQVFRKNQFQDIIEGQIIITGLALLFNKEFNNWDDLWKKQAQPEEEPEIPQTDPPADEATKEEEPSAQKSPQP